MRELDEQIAAVEGLPIDRTKIAPRLSFERAGQPPTNAACRTPQAGFGPRGSCADVETRSTAPRGARWRAAKVTHGWMESGTRRAVDNGPPAQRLPEVCRQSDLGATHGSCPDRASDPGKQHFVLAFARDQAATALDDDNDRPLVRRHPDPRAKHVVGSLQLIRRQRQRASASSSSRRRTPRRGAATHHEQHRDQARQRNRGG
jgi:hypothetical protein